jgi:hypothetical protein
VASVAKGRSIASFVSSVGSVSMASYLGRFSKRLVRCRVDKPARPGAKGGEDPWYSVTVA